MKKVLMILGGMWHNFDGFEKCITPVFDEAGYKVEATYDLDQLLHLPEGVFSAVISDTCFSLHSEGHDDQGPEGLSSAQVQAIREWVSMGGGFLAVHAASVAGTSGADYSRLVGGQFIEHPPAFSFTVYPLYPGHYITEGVPCFTVFDEFYIEKLTTPVDLHMVAVDRGQAFPMVWSKNEGKGRVAHVAMGHSNSVWELPPYQKLLKQALVWVTGQD